jgi:hypothetical protein
MMLFLCFNLLTLYQCLLQFFVKLLRIYCIYLFCAFFLSLTPNSWCLQAEEMGPEETAVEEPAAAVVEEEAAVDPPPEAVVILDPSPAAQEGS